MHYQKDCNNVPNTHDLVQLSLSLDDELQRMVRNLVEVIGPSDRTMYPDRLDMAKIPADLFSRQTAEKARDITKGILEFATDRL